MRSRTRVWLGVVSGRKPVLAPAELLDHALIHKSADHVANRPSFYGDARSVKRVDNASGPSNVRSRPKSVEDLFACLSAPGGAGLTGLASKGLLNLIDLHLSTRYLTPETR